MERTITLSEQTYRALQRQSARSNKDESVGRDYARQAGLVVRGSLGILVEAYHRNVIDTDRLRLALTEIARRADIWISPALVERVLWEVLEE